MRKFVFSTLVFIVTFMIATEVFYESKIRPVHIAGMNVYKVMERSLAPNKEVKILLAGDSVGWQLFEPLNSNDDMTSLACNQAIDVIGHYLLFDNFFSKPNSVEKLHFLYNPFSLSNDLNHKFTYNYFLKPFYSHRYVNKITPYAMAQIDKIPFSTFSRLSFVKMSSFSPSYSPEVNRDYVLSITSLDYFGKIEDLMSEKNIDFKILSPPIKESRKSEVLELKRKYQSSAVRTKTMDEYFDNILFLPDSFYRDDIHFKWEHVKYARNLVLSQFEKVGTDN